MTATTTRRSVREPAEQSGPAPAAVEVEGFAGNLIRPDDQVRLTFQLINGTVDAATNQILALEPEDHVFYLVSFGSQHTTEDTISIDDTPPDEPLGHRRALPSRVCVEIPAGTEYTVGNLLDLAGYALRVDPRADGAALDPGDEQVEPAGDVTSIEVPASLILSPSSAARFAASPQPITRGNVSELWRARLTASVPTESPSVRAIAHRSGATEFPVDDFDLIVDQTTGALGVPLQVNELALSSQGATVDLEGEWESVLAGYRHRAINGRDLHVEFVIRGYLAPFGHAASLTTLSERVLRVDESGDLTASLTADTYLAISSPTVTYPADTSIFMPHEGRRLAVHRGRRRGQGPRPRRSGTHRDAEREHAESRQGLSADPRRRRSAGLLHRHRPRRTPTASRSSSPPCSSPTPRPMRPTTPSADSDTVLAKLATWYADAAEDSRRDLQLGGQSVGWADPSPRGGSGSVQTTNRIRISLDRPDTGATIPADVSATLENLRRPAFYPGVARAWIVDQASTTTLGGDPPETEVSLAQRWLDFGIGSANVDLGYLDLTAPTVVLPTTDALGMLAASLNVGTFGQLLGAGFKLPELGGEAWMWDALEALGGVGGEGLPKLLGSLELPDLIPPINVADPAAARQLPQLKVEPQFEHPDVPEIPTGVCFHFTWEPKVQSFPKDSNSPTFVADDETHVLLALTTCVPEVDTTFTAALERFTVQLPPVIAVVAIDFEHVTYHNVNGSSSIEAKVADWRFVGALSWLEPLKDLLAGLLDNGAPTFEGGIFIDYGIPIPGFKLGVLGVSGLRVDLALDLPDSGASAIGLDVGRRDDPFRITIMGFGGDGSFGLEVDAKQLVRIEGALAVTYELAVDVFLVAAALSASLGTYIEFARTEQFPEGEVTFGAYVSLTGSLRFIGIVEVSGAVTVSLEYSVNSKVLRGCAEVTAEVSFFGKHDVTRDVAVEVQLGDGQGVAALLGGAAMALAGAAAEDLSFRDHFTKPQWNSYCAAFAA